MIASFSVLKFIVLNCKSQVKFEKGFSNIAHDEKLSAEDEKAFREGQRLADTHFLSEKERREWGIPKRYPSDKPGVFMHQKGVLDFLKITPRSKAVVMLIS